MKIAAVAIVRDVADVIGVSLLHHLHSGVDVMYVVDHASADGTDAILARAARRFPIRWLRYDGYFMQSEITTDLARLAHRDGADWIVPIDGDEFWWTSDGNLRDALSDCDAAAIECEVVNFVQRRDQIEKTPQALLTMTRRIETPVGSEIDAHALVASRKASFVEVPFPRKWLCRASDSLEILYGAHGVTGVHGPRVAAENIKILHAPLRAKSIFPSRAAHGERVAAMNANPEMGWQMRWWKKVAAEGASDIEWAANSYLDDALDLVGEPRPLTIDRRLHDCVAKWIDDELVNARADAAAVGGATRLAPLTRRDTNVDVELREVVRAAELRGTRRSLESAIHAVAARDAIIADLEATLARIARSLPGRIYRKIAASKTLRRLVRLVSGLR